MSPQYLENPILLVNSSGPHATSGRNVRARFRTQQAAKRIRSETQNGHFGMFEIDPKPYVTTADNIFAHRKPSHFVNQVTDHDVDTITQRPNKVPRVRSSSHKVVQDEPPLQPCSALNPSEILAYANFHIRLLASMTILTNRSRDSLSQVLLCRQWSCVSFPADGVGKSDVLDSAIKCVEATVRQFNATSSSSLSDLLLYEDALHKLQVALRNSTQHEHEHLRASIQLLAIYEMLKSLDNPGWVQHISGAKLLAQPGAMICGVEQGDRSLHHVLTVPIVAEALLTGDGNFFYGRPWANLLQSAYDVYGPLFQSSSGLATCILDLPMLIVDVKTLCGPSHGLDAAVKQSLLDRANLLKSRIRSDLLNDERHMDGQENKLGAFDGVGLRLAGLIALDRIIASLQPIEVSAQELIEDQTEEFCAQMLHLDLGANGAYAASDLMKAFRMSPFRQEAAYIIVFPGRNGN